MVACRTCCEETEELRNRVRALLLLITHELQGKKEIAERRKKDIEQLEK